MNGNIIGEKQPEWASEEELTAGLDKLREVLSSSVRPARYERFPKHYVEYCGEYLKLLLTYCGQNENDCVEMTHTIYPHAIYIKENKIPMESTLILPN